MMDLRERFKNDEELMRLLLDGFRKQIYTVSTVSISADSADGHTTSAQPTVKGRVEDSDGNVTYEALPEHQDVPIHFSSGGGYTSTHPVKKADTGFVVYASHPIDEWHAQGGVQEPIDRRSFHLSDAMYVPGVRSDTNKLQNVSTVSQQHRTDDGNHFQDIHSQNGVTHQSTNLVLALVGNSTSHAVSKSGIKANSPKILWNC